MGHAPSVNCVAYLTLDMPGMGKEYGRGAHVTRL